MSPPSVPATGDLHVHGEAARARGTRVRQAPEGHAGEVLPQLGCLAAREQNEREEGGVMCGCSIEDQGSRGA